MASLYEDDAAKIERPEPRRLGCVGCARVARGYAIGWRAYLTNEDQVAVYCPACAEREFGSS
jgi:hypothetical protein